MGNFSRNILDRLKGGIEIAENDVFEAGMNGAWNNNH